MYSDRGQITDCQVLGVREELTTKQEKDRLQLSHEVFGGEECSVYYDGGYMPVYIYFTFKIGECYQKANFKSKNEYGSRYNSPKTRAGHMDYVGPLAEAPRDCK